MATYDVNEQEIKKVVNKYAINLFGFGFVAGMLFSGIMFTILLLLVGE